MKKLALLIISLSFLNLTACRPEDQKLNRPDRNGSAGQQGQSETGVLKVGTYGQPIWVYQNLNSIHSLILNCLSKQTADSGIAKCPILLAGTESFQEHWSVEVTYTKSNGNFEIQKAMGQLQDGYAMDLFNKTPTFVQYSKKGFAMVFSDAANANLYFFARGEMGSSTTSISFDSKMNADLQIDNESWSFVSLDYRMALINRGQVFTVKSENLQLSLNESRSCFEPNGTFEVVEVNRSQAKIQVNAASATQVGGKWKQNFTPCSVPNSYYLYY